MYILINSNITEKYFDELEIDDYSGSGSDLYDYLNITNSTENDDDYDRSDPYIVFIALSPLMIGAAILVLATIYVCIIIPILNCLENQKSKIANYFESRKVPIRNKHLSPMFIKQLNSKNKEKVKTIENNSDCPICFNEMNFENKSKLVFLDCGHVYCKSCIQDWVKTKVQSFANPDCPKCRLKIVDLPRKKVVININYNYDSDDNYSSDQDEY